MPPRLAFLGPPGSFGEQAALAYMRRAERVAVASNAALVTSVSKGDTELAIAPIENSLDGAISETLDALLREEDVRICAELVLPVEQQLIAAPGATLDSIEVVMSHPSALAQCRDFLQQRLPNARPEAALSTSAAVAAAVATQGAAAIGTRRAAELNGGVILAENIQDVGQNKTRFVVLARQDAPASGDDKTSIAFTTAHDRPGSLLAVLRELSDRGLNLTRIESRPSREDIGIYVFLIDFQGHRTDALVMEALAAARQRAYYFRVFGSYPRYAETAARGE